MDINFDIVGACQNIQAEAEALAGSGNYAYNLKKKTGALDFITSQENGGPVDTNFISYNSGRKYATLQMFYDQRTKECQISDNCDITVCDEGSTPQRKEATVRITKCVKTPIREYSTRDMIALCMDKSTFIQKRAGSDLRAAAAFLSTRILAEMGAEIGTNDEWDGTSTAAGQFKPIQLIKNNIDSQGQPGPLPGNWAEVMLDYANNQLTGVPAAIGQGNLEYFYKLHGYSCCNATTPYGEANVEGDARFYLDQSANTVFGTNKFVLVAPGALKMVTFNVNEDIDINDDSVVHTVIKDPHGYPFSWDLDAYWDHCSKTWKVMYSLMWEVFNTFQPDSFGAAGEGESPDASPDCADPLDGMLGVFGYEATAA